MRQELWGYSPDEDLSNDDLLKVKYQVRPCAWWRVLHPAMSVARLQGAILLQSVHIPKMDPAHGAVPARIRSADAKTPES